MELVEVSVISEALIGKRANHVRFYVTLRILVDYYRDIVEGFFYSTFIHIQSYEGFM